MRRFYIHVEEFNPEEIFLMEAFLIQIHHINPNESFEFDVFDIETEKLITTIQHNGKTQ